MIDPDTGELVSCFVPAYPLDRAAVRDRGIKINDLVMMDVFRDRNPRFWRKFHKLASFLADNVEELGGLQAHDALKKVQLDSRVWCEVADFVLEDGQVLRHWVTKSLAFDVADDIVAEEVWNGIVDHVVKTYFPDWDRDQVAEATSYWEREQ